MSVCAGLGAPQLAAAITIDARACLMPFSSPQVVAACYPELCGWASRVTAHAVEEPTAGIELSHSLAAPAAACLSTLAWPSPLFSSRCECPAEQPACIFLQCTLPGRHAGAANVHLARQACWCCEAETKCSSAQCPNTAAPAATSPVQLIKAVMLVLGSVNAARVLHVRRGWYLGRTLPCVE